ncbi:transcriptional regulator [Cuniculiplasma sp. SKW3]|uniref:transcriptional regulator n=1 Tax=unclassified Cuniculiplasma TaxID=2619706 RepID=UPI003FD681EF
MSEERELNEIVGDDIYSNGIRTGILIGLYGIDKITFTELLLSTGLPKSSLHVQLKYLQEGDYVTIKTELTLRRPMTFIRITEKGKDKVKNYFFIIEKYRNEPGKKNQK